jgi:membrane protein
MQALERLQDRLFQTSRNLRPPWGPMLRALLYPLAILRDWLAGEINIRAMSLAYTTLLSLVPLMVFSFSILKGLGARTDLRFILLEFFRPLGSAANQLTESVLQFVANMRGDVLGSIGLAFLLYTVISTIQKVEASFNFVWRVDRPRNFARRFAEYLSVILVGPIMLAVALGLLGSAEQSPMARWLRSIAPLAWILGVFGQLVPYAIVTIVFTLMYSLIPNTRVEFKPALIGGVTAGIVWALVGKVFTALILYSSEMMAVYSGFAIVLTTLIWVNLSWLILLIGAQLAFYVQFPQYLHRGALQLTLTSRAREQAALSVMYLIGRDYRAGKSLWTTNRLAAELDIPGAALAPVLGCLEDSSLLVVTDKELLMPGRDPAVIELAAVIEAVRACQKCPATIGHPVVPAVRVIAEVEAAMSDRLGTRSLQDLIAGA